MIHPTNRRSHLTVLLAAILSTTTFAQESGPADEEDLDLAWPRIHDFDDGRVVIHQPQITRWTDFEEIVASAALEVTPSGATEAELGSIKLVASTIVNTEAREVLYGRPELRGMLFPDTPTADYKDIRSLVERAVAPSRALVMSLDEIVSYLDPQSAGIAETPVNFEPPPIVYRSAPTILVILMGPPRLERVSNVELLYAVNTNWDLFLNPLDNAYYLLNGEGWLTTRDLDGGQWTQADALPIALFELPEDDDWNEVRERVPGMRLTRAPEVIVRHGPTELIVTDGMPVVEPIADTTLGYVTNTDSDLFRVSGTGTYYYLAAGRWFRADALYGPWTAATADLPDDFARIPFDHPRAHVLASVPGTPDAIIAVVLASIPEKVTVELGALKPQISYQDEPVFMPIEGSDGVSYALNSPNDVFLVEGLYFSCVDGIWFASKSATGPWGVCRKVPDAIYTIPASSDKHYVTYVKVYDSSADTVTVGQTGGYTGEYVALGLLVFGLGWVIAEADNVSFFVSTGGIRYPSYGCGARYDMIRGRYYRAATRNGPYGGAGRWASYDPRVGRYTRGAYRYGPRGAATARSMYNPYHGRYGASVRGATPYASWGQSVVMNDNGDWARAGHRSNARGTAAGVKTSEGGFAAKSRDRRGNKTAVAGREGDDLYVARNGRLYKRDDDGQWQRRADGGWNDVNPDRPRSGDRTAQSQQIKQLRRDATARHTGQKRTRRYSRGRR